ncbi:MAG: S8 family serine peptidase [Acidimicrobiales bacterium]
MEEWVNAYSATGPGADSANPGAVTVGASRNPSSPLRAGYSSVGPTFDDRAGIDLIGPSCLPVTNFGSCFTGTSASAPVISGALAMLRAAGVVESASGADAVIPFITADQGVAGPDPEYGHGSLLLPPPSSFGVIPANETCMGLVPTIVGTSFADTITGTPGADVILAGAGDDVVNGNGGADTICGGGGRDIIDGGGGSDAINGEAGRDRIRGGTGADVLIGGPGGDRLVGNVGSDEIRGEGGNDREFGGAGNDQLRGGAGRDRLAGSPGVDSLHGGVGIDTCAGAGFGEADDPGDTLARCELR